MEIKTCNSSTRCIVSYANTHKSMRVSESYTMHIRLDIMENDMHGASCNVMLVPSYRELVKGPTFDSLTNFC